MAMNELLMAEFNEEMKKTRTALQRVPVDKKDFAPHPKSSRSANLHLTLPNSQGSA
jgi:hypothetical protein